jgi:UDP-N-acetylglucosamine 2-epimerase (non-hydrolysing)
MKVVIVLGTRPEIIRLSRVIARLRALCDLRVVHTNQNFDRSLSDTFLDDLGVGAPDHSLGAPSTSFAAQVAAILSGVERVLIDECPDRVLILGDTNSGLSALIAKRLGIPVYHMEAGNRCYDDRVPEETNRRVIDHSSDVLMPYTERSRQNLLREGIAGERIFVTGNPIFEVIRHFEPQIAASKILGGLNVSPRRYILVTMHRAENVDVEDRFAGLVDALDHLQRDYRMPVIVSTHPRTRARMTGFAIDGRNPDVHFLEPFNFFDFVSLERQAFCILSDSGTVQEEAAIFQIPNVTIRDVTERPETIECGSNILSGARRDHISLAVKTALAGSGTWRAPSEYLVPNVSETVVKIVLGYEGPSIEARRGR